MTFMPDVNMYMQKYNFLNNDITNCYYDHITIHSCANVDHSCIHKLV